MDVKLTVESSVGSEEMGGGRTVVVYEEEGQLGKGEMERIVERVRRAAVVGHHRGALKPTVPAGFAEEGA